MGRKINTSPPRIHDKMDPPPSSATDHTRALNAIKRRYEKKVGFLGMSQAFIDEKAEQDLEVVRKGYLETGKGEPTDELLIVSILVLQFLCSLQKLLQTFVNSYKSCAHCCHFFLLHRERGWLPNGGSTKWRTMLDSNNREIAKALILQHLSHNTRNDIVVIHFCFLKY